MESTLLLNFSYKGFFLKAQLNLLRNLLLTTALFTMAAAAQAPGIVRIALIIGNSAYPSAPLTNPANDAKAMSETMRGLGFIVIELLDGNKVQMANAIVKAREALQGQEGIGMLYYAGHGLQIDARNYMVPVDAKIAKATDVPKQTIDVSSVVDAFKLAGNHMNILVLDACRNNPFGSITTGKGLAPLDAPSGTFLAYATAPGNVAGDGDEKSGNGLYTQYLLQELKKPESHIEDVFKRVRFGVRKASNGAQIPWESTSLEEDFQFNDGKIIAFIKPTAQSMEAEFSLEKLDWDRIKDSKNADDFYAFIQKFPRGTIAGAATARLNEITKPTLVVQGAGSDGKSQTYIQTLFHLGDTYKLHNTTTKNGEDAVDHVLVRKVISVKNDEITVEEIETTNNIETSRLVLLFTPQGGRIGIKDVMRFNPPDFSLPTSGILQVGVSWKSLSQLVFQNASLSAPINKPKYSRITARESLTVIAGTFDTLRIETEQEFNGDNSMICTLWQSTKIPIFPVKVECRSDNLSMDTELMSFTRGI